VFHRENWHLLTITQSEADATASIYQAGDLVYGPQTGTIPTRPVGFVQTYGGTDRPDQVRVAFPDGLVSFPTLQNLTIYPSLVLTNGVDLDIDPERRLLRFKENPFDNSLVPKRDIVDDEGKVIDSEIALWIYKGEIDLNYVYMQFGYALHLKMQSSEGYKTLLNAFWDMHVLGPAKGSLETLLSAITGAPIALDPEETVEVVQTESTSKLVVTSSRVYRVSLTANVIVSVGDVINLGDPITDAISITELGGYDPDLTAIPLLSVSNNFISGGFLSELSFRNQLGTLSYLGVDEDGKAVVCLETSGFPADIEQFCQLVHARGKAAGETLANLLDVRTNPTTEPTADNLPSQVNTLEFLLDNVLKSNLFIIRVRQASFGDDAPGLPFIRLLRDVVPPHTAYIVFVELSAGEEVIDLISEGSEDEAGAVESVDMLLTTGFFTETLGEASEVVVGSASYEDAFVTVRAVALDCN
jgi:hypothetical protein